MPQKRLTWQFNLFLDLCHSGSCIDEARKWVVSNEGAPIKGIEDKWDVVKYFIEPVNCRLVVDIYTSCATDEKANDVGEGKGGLWTNTFTAKGVLPPKNKSKWTQNKYRIFNKRQPDRTVVTQHSQHYRFLVIEKIVVDEGENFFSEKKFKMLVECNKLHHHLIDFRDESSGSLVLLKNCSKIKWILLSNLWVPNQVH